MPNRLIHETSPYLLQHADNPVDWYPWGPEAFERAKQEDKPILLSIGYSACHWCHVMEHESFEDPEIARLMNELFINIKVDREERPDLDSLYMEAVQAMTGHGGWPMTVFLTPDGVPFYAGTYFPPEDRGGMPGFKRVLLAVAEAYRQRKDEVLRQAEQVRAFLQARIARPPEEVVLTASILDSAYTGLASEFDATYGGFGRAPKFPQPMNLEFLLRTHVRTRDPQPLQIVERTLEHMARGGIYDQLGGGFHRYSTDAMWLVPHFEKMLYDNAQLARVYLQAWQLTRRPLYRRICEETLAYVVREMTSPEGSFYATQDADSEGEEGKFFLWTPAEVRSVLNAEEARVALLYYDITERGNFEGKNILHVPHDDDVAAHLLGISEDELQDVLAHVRRKLFEAREQRMKPGRDEKVLASWNGLMMRTFAEAAGPLGRADYRELAERNARFVLSAMRRDGRLLHSYKDGIAKVPGLLEDYAAYANALISLYETTFDLEWLEHARALVAQMLDLFWDEEIEGFYDTAHNAEQLIARPRHLYDDAMPSGNSLAVEALLRMEVFTGDTSLGDRAERVLQGMARAMAQYGRAFGHLLNALDFRLSTPKEIVITGRPDAPDTRALLEVVWQRYLPNRVLALRDPAWSEERVAGLPLLSGRVPLDGRATAYVCENYTCRLPVTEPEALAQQLEQLE